MEQLMSGAIGMGFCVAGLFFLRFWRETGDRLFALFALAFFLMAASRAYLLSDPTVVREDRYWVRFAAFVLILVAILDKNRSRRPPRSGNGPGPGACSGRGSRC